MIHRLKKNTQNKRQIIVLTQETEIYVHYTLSMQYTQKVRHHCTVNKKKVILNTLAEIVYSKVRF